MEQKFQLYTWQSSSWDITRDKRDSSKALLAWGDHRSILEPLYEKLEKVVGTLDFVWCFPAYEYWGQDERMLWKLDVADSSDVFRFLDDKVWEDIHDDAQKNRQTEQAIWDSLILEKGEGVKRLFDRNNKNVSPLVHVPLCTSITVINKRFNIGNYYGDVKYENLPTSECEAKKRRDEGRIKYMR